MRSIRDVALAGLAAAAACCAAGADVIDFEILQHGEIVGGQYAASHGVTISAVNPNRAFDLAIGFDSRRADTADDDLEDLLPWSGGNLAPDTEFGLILILAENDFDGNGDGLIDVPDDEGLQPAGIITFDFDVPIIDFGFDLIDVEDTVSENSALEFFLGQTLVGTVLYSDFITPGSDHYDPTIAYGDHSANRIQPITAASLGGTAFDRVVLNLGGSGGFDNLVFTAVPAPGAIAILAAGLLAPRRRRRS